MKTTIQKVSPYIKSINKPIKRLLNEENLNIKCATHRISGVWNKTQVDLLKLCVKQ